MTARRPDVASWLRDQTPAHLELLGKMRTRLDDAMSALPDKATPGRDWCRVYEAYQAGYHALVNDVREHAKLALLAKRIAGATQPMTDEELERELDAIGKERVLSLPTEDLATELARRGIVVPVVEAK